MPNDRVLTAASAEDVGFDKEKLEAAVDTIRQGVESGRFPGAVYLIARHGKIVARGAFGLADV
ncbi:hypothetical protein ACFL1X_07070 [Candidatus Hydrogenedentota bacterium]